MVDSNDRFDPSRRDLLRYSAIAGLAGLAGCSTTDDGGGDGSDGSDGGGDGSDGSDGDMEDGGDGSDGGDGDMEDGGDGSDGGDAGPYTIGVLNSLTGSLDTFGQRNERGMGLALEAVNEVGVGGRELELEVQDTESKPQSGVSAAQNLINQVGVPYIIGAVSSGVTLSVYESVVQETDVVQMSQNSTGLGLTEQPGLLRVAPSGQTQAVALANIVAEDGYDQVALTYVNNNFGQSLADAFVESYEGEVAYQSAHNQEQSSYDNLVTEMNDSGAEAWVLVSYQPETTTIVNNAFESGYDPQYYAGDSSRGDSVLENTPEGSMAGMKLVEPSAPVEEENYQEFVSTFESEYDTQPTTWAAFAYDAVVIAAISILAADEFTGAALTDVVRDVTRPEGEQVTSFEAAAEILEDGGSASDVDYQGVSGPIDLDENGDPAGFLQVFEVQDHSYVGVDFIS